ncbi:hypothetical protein F9B85_10030 [Heliorestis acidaminivorans]|uniref:S1 motif domain-containing protein n=1 Tax=Heliorestis acidaminivorans TaxID=553427 RepID=A0A6I0ET39_9FIRM|nr:hypothetical protein [Heliorestis acidaminivorans]KAB2952141.1 hypothetical protein F9B85_10030 [Heliorestis acidaminivorans]
MSNIVSSLRPEGYEQDRKQQESIWPEIYRAQQNGLVMQGLATGLEHLEAPVRDEKGKVVGIEEQPCLIVFLDADVRVIIPLSASGVSNEERLRFLLGKQVAFKVKAVDRDINLVVASRQEALQQIANLTWKELEVGKTRDAVFRRVGRKYGMVDLGGVYTILKAENASHGYIEDLREKYQAGDTVTVAITGLDKEKKEVTVSLKPLLADPWKTVSSKYKLGGMYIGVVTGNSESGFFVTLETGVYSRVNHPKFIRIDVGDKVILQIQGINAESKKIRAIITANITGKRF